jgi:hypothetical protein
MKIPFSFIFIPCGVEARAGAPGLDPEDGVRQRIEHKKGSLKTPVFL